MKTNIKIVLIVLGILSFCCVGLVFVGYLMDDTDADSQVAAATSEVQVLHTETAVDPTATAVPETTRTIDSAVVAYKDHIVGYNELVMEATQQFQTEMIEASADPALLVDQGWMVRVMASVAAIETSLEQIANYEPIPEGYEEVDRYYGLAHQRAINWRVKFIQAIDKLDEDALMSANEHLEKMAEYIDQAAEASPD